MAAKRCPNQEDVFPEFLQEYQAHRGYSHVQASVAILSLEAPAFRRTWYMFAIYVGHGRGYGARAYPRPSWHVVPNFFAIESPMTNA